MTSRCCHGDVDKQHVDVVVYLQDGHVFWCHVAYKACRENWTMTSSVRDTVTSQGAILLAPAVTTVHKSA